MPLVIQHQNFQATGAHWEHRDPFDRMLAKSVQAQKTSLGEQELGIPFKTDSAFFCNKASFQTLTGFLREPQLTGVGSK